MLQGLRRYRHAFRNWLSVAWKAGRDEYPFSAIRRDGTCVELYNSNQAWANSYDLACEFNPGDQSLRFCWDGHPVVLYGTAHNGDVAEVFGRMDYAPLDVERRTVVDIGANIGDSSIYFALRGAQRVIAVEPFPQSFEFLVRNLEANRLGPMAIPVHSGAAPVAGSVRLDPRIPDTTVVSAVDFPSGVPVPMHPLEWFVDEFEVHDGALKMDCEGGERDILLQAADWVLHRFATAQVEFHGGPGPLQAIADRWKRAGFDVRWDTPDARWGNGFLFARRL